MPKFLSKFFFFKPVVYVSITLSSFTLMGCQSGPYSATPKPLPMPKISYGSEEILNIMPNKEPCNSARPMLCLVATNSNGTMFQIPYNWIEGFNHVNGVEYTINVRPEIDDNNGSQATGHWVLQSIISSQ